jgi:integrase
MSARTTSSNTAGKRRRSTGQVQAMPVEPISMEQLRDKLLDYYMTNCTPYGTFAGKRKVLDILRDGVGVRSSAELEDPNIIRRFTEFCAAENYAQGTTSTMVVRLRTITREGHRDLGLLRSMPDFPEMRDPRHLPRSVRSVPPPETEIRCLLIYLRDDSESWEGGRLYALVSLIALSGIALTQALQLRVTDIHLETNTIDVRVQRSGRIKSKRLSNEAIAILRSWLPRTKCDHVFPGKEQVGPWHISGREEGNGPHPALNAATRAARLSHITFEQLRRFHAEQSVTSMQFGIKADVPTAIAPAPETKSQTKHATVSSEAASIEIVSETHVSLSGAQQEEVRPAQLDVIRILLDAYPGGVSLKEMEARSKFGAPRSTLRILMKNNVEFARRIRTPGIGYPGKKTNPYKILSCREVCDTM